MDNLEKKAKRLVELNEKLKGLIAGEKDWLANMANASALIFNDLEKINWAGFYLLKDRELVLGPFQGLPACIRIEIGKGVCGSAVRDEKTYVVKDVHQFDGHIACDQASQSELVVPLIKEGKIFGVLDIDSPVKERFDEVDKKYFEKFAEIVISGSDFDQIFS